MHCEQKWEGLKWYQLSKPIQIFSAHHRRRCLSICWDLREEQTCPWLGISSQVGFLEAIALVTQPPSYLRGPCLQQITDSKRQAAASLQQQRQPLSYMPAVFTAGGGRGSFSGIINSLLVSRARSADWTLLEWPFWVMIQCFEMCCYFSYYYMMRHWTAKAGELGSHFSSVSRLRV